MAETSSKVPVRTETSSQLPQHSARLRQRLHSCRRVWCIAVNLTGRIDHGAPPFVAAVAMLSS